MFASLALAATLTAAPAALSLHPGATTSVSISGAQGVLHVAAENGIVTASVDAQPGTIDVVASATAGTDTLHVTDDAGDAVDIPVQVAFDAGRFPSRVSLRITGWPIAWDWLWEQIEDAVGRAATVAPGATLVVTQPSPLPSPPPPDESIRLDVPVVISGQPYFTASGIAQIAVTNVPVEPVAPPLLLYDDDPERVDANGVIYRATVTRAQAVRLYYYHDDGGDPRRLAVVLSADRPTQVQVIDASSGPNLDVLSVGHAVSESALEMAERNQGIVVTLRPGRFTALRDTVMTSKQGVAGAVSLQVLSGGPAQIEVLSAAPGTMLADALDGPWLPRDGHHRDGTFAIRNFGMTALAYTAGGPDVSVQYGTRAAAPQNVAAASGGTDFGDYGVIQTMLFTLVNPLAAPATVYLYERPLGGIVRSSFLVDGVLRQVGCVRDSAQRYLVSAFQLAPGGRYQLSVATMPDGGSNYPLEVGLTGTEPQPAAPPISSPQGCFPKPAH
jgi:hypothetical protein